MLMIETNQSLDAILPHVAAGQSFARAADYLLFQWYALKMKKKKKPCQHIGSPLPKQQNNNKKNKSLISGTNLLDCFCFPQFPIVDVC